MINLISTKRFNLVPLTLDHVTEKYLSWLATTHSYSRYIAGCDEEYTLDDLRQYVEQKSSRDDVIFLAIENKAGLHIGNVKYEPIDFVTHTAEMGILIGDHDWLGVGVAGEVIASSSRWLSAVKGIKRITLGVHPENERAYAAYKKLGFTEVSSTPTNVRMEMEL